MPSARGKSFPHGTIGFTVATPSLVKFVSERVRPCQAFWFTRPSGALLLMAARPRRTFGLPALRSPLTSESTVLRSPLPRRFEEPLQTLTVGIFPCFQLHSYNTSGVEDLSWPPGEMLLSVGYCLLTLRFLWLPKLIAVLL